MSCDYTELCSLEDASRLIMEQLEQELPTELLPLEDCLGRILAQDVIAVRDVPAVDTAMVDGYAVRLTDMAQSLTLSLAGQALAGKPFSHEWPEDTCVRIMTGAPIPEGCDAVIMQEAAVPCGNRIEFSHAPEAGSHIRRAGDDIRQGTQMLIQGLRLEARHVALLASLGFAQVQVFTRLTVAVFSTGDEVKPVTESLNPGDVYDSNRYGIKGLLANLPVTVLDLGIIPDDPEQLKATFLQANAEADVVITTGGVSVGEADYTKDILEEVGEMRFWKLAMKPGKPLAFGRLPESWFFGLPGNPVSAFVSFEHIVLPALAKLLHWQRPKSLLLPATVSGTLQKEVGRMEFQRGLAFVDSTGLHVTSTGNQDSGVFSSLLMANCYIILDAERGDVAAGEEVSIQLFGVL